MTSKDVPACAHTRVHVGTASDNSVYCSNCTAVWYLPFVMAAEIEQRTDLVASVTSAMLWDFHERAVEKYGKDVADTVKPPGPSEAMFEYTPDTCPAHEYNSGKCVNCGASQFLGSE